MVQKMAKKEKEATYSHRVAVKFKPSEFLQIRKYLDASTCKTFSNYIRKVSLQEPIVKTYRNLSADDFLEEMIELKNELKALGSSYLLSLKKLQTFNHSAEIKTWVVLNESKRRLYEGKVTQILEKLNQIHELWLQQ